MDTQSQKLRFHTRHSEHKTKHTVHIQQALLQALTCTQCSPLDNTQPHKMLPVWNSWSKCMSPNSMLHENHGV